MTNTHNDKEVLIIIPAYNERGNIEKLISRLRCPEITDIADILVMNDASTDGTNRAVNQKTVAVVTHVFNLGYGSGLQLCWAGPPAAASHHSFNETAETSWYPLFYRTAALLYQWKIAERMLYFPGKYQLTVYHRFTFCSAFIG